MQNQGRPVGLWLRIHSFSPHHTPISQSCKPRHRAVKGLAQAPQLELEPRPPGS